MKLAHFGDEAHAGHRLADVRVVPWGAHHEVVHGGTEAVLVEEAGDARACHAPPAVRVRVEQARDHRDPRVCCSFVWCVTSGQRLLSSGVFWNRQSVCFVVRMVGYNYRCCI